MVYVEIITKATHCVCRNSSDLEKYTYNLQSFNNLWPKLHYNWLVCVLSAVPLGIIVVDNDADLEQVRNNINQLHEVRISHTTASEMSGLVASDNPILWCHFSLVLPPGGGTMERLEIRIDLPSCQRFFF